MAGRLAQHESRRSGAIDPFNNSKTRSRRHRGERPGLLGAIQRVVSGDGDVRAHAQDAGQVARRDVGEQPETIGVYADADSDAGRARTWLLARPATQPTR